MTDRMYLCEILDMAPFMFLFLSPMFVPRPSPPQKIYIYIYWHCIDLKSWRLVVKILVNVMGFILSMKSSRKANRTNFLNELKCFHDASLTEVFKSVMEWHISGYRSTIQTINCQIILVLTHRLSSSHRTCIIRKVSTNPTDRLHWSWLSYFPGLRKEVCTIPVHSQQ